MHTCMHTHMHTYMYMYMYMYMYIYMYIHTHTCMAAGSRTHFSKSACCVLLNLSFEGFRSDLSRQFSAGVQLRGLYTYIHPSI